MTNIQDWRDWPQVLFDIDLFDDVHEWVMNRFGIQDPGKEEVVLVSKNSDHFRIAIKDYKVLDVTLLKFKCDLCACEHEQIKTREIESAQIDAELKKLIAELQVKLQNSPSYDKYVKGAKEDGLFSYSNGDWIHVKE